MVLELAYKEKVSSVGLVSRKRTKKTTSDRDSGSEENRERACGDVNYSADIPTHNISRRGPDHGDERGERVCVCRTGRYCRRSANLDPLQDKVAIARTRNILITAA